MSNLSVRVLVAIVGIPAVTALVIAGGFAFYGFILLVSVLGLAEFYRLARVKGSRPQTWSGMVIGIAVTSATVTIYGEAVWNPVTLVAPGKALR